MAKMPPAIDLLQKQKGKNLDAVINWTLTIGRVLVIITECIALAAFIYRFSLDQQLIDLHSKIRNEQAIVEAQQKYENSYLNLQDRLSLASSAIKLTNLRTKIYQDIIGFAPVGLTFNSVSLFSDRVSIEANVSSIVPLTYFVNSLKSYPEIDSVSIDKIENNSESSTITVGITANLKQDAQLNEPTN